MKTLGTIILILLLFAGLSYAGDESFTEYKFLDMSRATRVCSITITNNDKEATINFCGDKVVYSGELPIDESAKIFFEYVFDNMRCREQLYNTLKDLTADSSNPAKTDLQQYLLLTLKIIEARKGLEECKP